MVIDQLAKLGIRVQNREGEQKTQCPKCSHIRRKKKDRCLSVKIEHEQACWNCWHCSYTGGTNDKNIERGRDLGRAKTQAQPSDFGASRRRLRYGFLSGT